MSVTQKMEVYETSETQRIFLCLENGDRMQVKSISHPEPFAINVSLENGGLCKPITVTLLPNDKVMQNWWRDNWQNCREVNVIVEIFNKNRATKRFELRSTCSSISVKRDNNPINEGLEEGEIWYFHFDESSCKFLPSF